MERTTGSPCLSARELLAAGEAGIEATDRLLLDRHRERCTSCRELGEALAWLEKTLAGMAELRPDPGFLRDVLRATSGRRRRPTSIEEWLAAWLGVTIRRPRFALEAAYVGAVVLWLIVGTSVSPLRGVPGQALEMVQAGSAQVLDASLGPMADALTMPASVSRRVWDATAGRLLDRGESEGRGRWRRIGKHAGTLSMHALKAMRLGSEGRFAEGHEQLHMMKGELLSIWDELTRGNTYPDLQTRTDSQSQEA
jgi:hypothetical protein